MSHKKFCFSNLFQIVLDFTVIKKIYFVIGILKYYSNYYQRFDRNQFKNKKRNSLSFIICVNNILHLSYNSNNIHLFQQINPIYKITAFSCKIFNCIEIYLRNSATFILLMIINYSCLVTPRFLTPLALNFMFLLKLVNFIVHNGVYKFSTLR